MSDYLHKKVVRLPFPKGMIKKNGEDPWDSVDDLREALGELWDNGDVYTFKLGFSDEADYIDWCYYRTYGKEAGDWGNVRLLTEKELEIIKPYFDRLKQPYKNNDLRVVDYCYYNCSEPPDYYSLPEDESMLFLQGKKITTHKE